MCYGENLMHIPSKKSTCICMNIKVTQKNGHQTYLLYYSFELTLKGNPGAAVKLLPCDHEVMVETVSCRNAGKDCIHKTQSGRTLPRTLRKR
jgi:hypothetical protein